MKLARLALCLALLAGACDRPADDGQTLDEASLRSEVPLPGFVRRDARLGVAHSGLRRLEFTPVSGESTSFDERITTDGAGRFALEPVPQAKALPLDWNTFELMHHLREGFFFRYRDFTVRDAHAFKRNWRLIDLGQNVVVAGRTCARFRVERTNGAAAFELSVDPVTDLVLASEEYDAERNRVAAMTYQDIDLTPDLSRRVWHESSNQETRLDPTRALGEQIEARALEPRLLPAGYSPLEAAVVQDGSASWLKLTYSDGVQPLFFLHAIDEASTGKAAQVNGQGVRETPRSTSAVIVFQLGAATAVQGRVNDFDVIAVGKVSQNELLDLIESSLP